MDVLFLADLQRPSAFEVGISEITRGPLDGLPFIHLRLPGLPRVGLSPEVVEHLIDRLIHYRIDLVWHGGGKQI